MKINVVMSCKTAIELALKELDVLEGRIEELLSFDLNEDEEANVIRHLLELEKAREELYKIKE
ncbi:hypothetical protein [Enterococcus italicus]|uniref:hypothetical protein n=1 Tax=Enterococcus italicus TaxID=246144 RepID=UPI003F475AA9